jgi:hypothetical protein
MTQPYPIHRPRDLGLLADALAASGLGEVEVRAVMGDNLVHLLQTVLPSRSALQRSLDGVTP